MRMEVDIACLDVSSQIFWFGDLNYRLNMMDDDVRKLVSQKRWDELINSDQVLFRAICVDFVDAKDNRSIVGGV